MRYRIESVAQKMAELLPDAPDSPPSELTEAPDKKILIIYWDSPYELSCKIWSL